MEVAVGLAREAYGRGDWPVGSLVVKDDAIVGQGRNEQVSRSDVTWHAETAAIRAATARLGTLDLAGTTLYTTMEPCPMCAGAAFLARIDRIVVGLRFATQRRTDLGAYSLEAFGTMMGWQFKLVSGVREAEYLELRRAWGRDQVASA
jgi:tRNA(adenine34) deaminase